jgi:hypothetical protein
MAVEEDYGACGTITSIKEETMHKINPIPNIQVKALINRNAPTVIENVEIDSSDTTKDKIWLNLPPSDNSNINVNNNRHYTTTSNQEEEEVYIDNDIGGIEYYYYLEKTVI